MPGTPQLSVTPSQPPDRSIRIPRRLEEVVSSSVIGNVMGDKVMEMNFVQSNSLDSSPSPQKGLEHPAELQYIRKAD
jgi:hypothetical protein